MTHEYTATDINSVYESLKKKTLSIQCSQPKRFTSLNHSTNLCTKCNNTPNLTTDVFELQTRLIYVNAMTRLTVYSKGGRQYVLVHLPITACNHMPCEYFRATPSGVSTPRMYPAG